MEFFVLIKFLNKKVPPNKPVKVFLPVSSNFLIKRWESLGLVTSIPVLPKIPREYQQIIFTNTSFYKRADFNEHSAINKKQNYHASGEDGFDDYQVVETKPSITHQAKEVLNKTVQKLKKWFSQQPLKWSSFKKL